MADTIRIGTRESALALWQTHTVKALLEAAWPDLTVAVDIMVTKGDRDLSTPLPSIGGKGAFTAELEAAMLSGDIDFAVHSLKDLPTDSPAGLIIGAIPQRAAVQDMLVSRTGYTVATLPVGAKVGTSSSRRAAQIRRQRQDIETIDIRGNIDTRIKKALDPAGPYDAIILARAGLDRMGFSGPEFVPIDTAEIVPAPGQGAIAVQCRDDSRSRELLAAINTPAIVAEVEAERAFLHALGGGCSVPVGALARTGGEILTLHGRVTSLDGTVEIDLRRTGEATLAGAHALAAALAAECLAQGADRLLSA